MRISKRTHLAATVIMATLAALLLTACTSSGQGLSHGSGHDAYRHYDRVYGDYSSFRYGHHGYGPHGHQRHFYRHHYFH